MKNLTKTILSLFCATSMILSSGCSALNDLLGNLSNASSTENSSDSGTGGSTSNITIDGLTGIFVGNYREVSYEEFVELSLNTEEMSLEDWSHGAAYRKQLQLNKSTKYTLAFSEYIDGKFDEQREIEINARYSEETNSYIYSSFSTNFWTSTKGNEKTLKTYNYSDGYKSYRNEIYGTQEKKVVLDDCDLFNAFATSRVKVSNDLILWENFFPLRAYFIRLDVNGFNLKEDIEQSNGARQLLVDDTDEKYIKMCMVNIAEQSGNFWIYDKDWNIVGWQVGNYTKKQPADTDIPDEGRSMLVLMKFEPFDGTIELPDDLDTYSTEDTSNWDFEMGNESL